MAVNCCVEPSAKLGDAGVTAMLETVAAVTVSEAVPLTPLSVAVMVEEPAAWPVASPAALMLASEGLDELHVTVEVTFFVEPSL